MKIHYSEIRGIGEGPWDWSVEFARLTSDALARPVDHHHSTEFHFYFTKTGKKTVRCLRTIIPSEAHRCLGWYSKQDTELFDASAFLWNEILVSDNGFASRPFQSI